MGDPPTASTWPLGSVVRVKTCRATCIEPVDVNEPPPPAAGLQSSAVVDAGDKLTALVSPPATSTLPVFSNAAAALNRPSGIVPAGLKALPVAVSSSP